jgi:uncharacterized protein YgbK (DUF1537 family)
MDTNPLALIIADDLSGAADSGVAFARRGVPTRVAFDATSGQADADVVVVDTDSRGAAPAAAAHAVATAVAGVAGARLTFKKIDSTLRGNIAAETAAMLRAAESTLAVCAPAFPATGRITVDGVQYAHGELVGDVPALFAGFPVTRIPLTVVRQGGLVERLDRAAGHGTQVVVVDAETDTDLGVVARAVTSLQARPVWVGSGGLADALARTLVPDPVPVRFPTTAGPVLVVVGSAAPQAAAQAAALRDAGVAEVAFPAAALLGGDLAVLRATAERVARRLAEGADVLVTIEDGHVIPSDRGRPAVTALATALAAAEPAAAALVVAGGETARMLCAALGATGLTLVGELQSGIVVGLLVGGPGWPVVTKSGAFGGAGGLLDAVIRLSSQREPVVGRAVRPNTEET